MVFQVIIGYGFWRMWLDISRFPFCHNEKSIYNFCTRSLNKTKMSAFQHNTFNLQMAQDYFAHLNPLAQRIASDISMTKLSYGQLWYAMKLGEQNDILNETLIKPEISLMYFDKFSSSIAPLSSDLSSSASSSSADVRVTSAENILQSLPRRKEQKCSIKISGSLSTNSLMDAIRKQSKNLLSNTLAARAQQTMALHLHGKLRPPSSLPPPPPIGIAKASRAVNANEAKSSLGLCKKLRNKHEMTTFDGCNHDIYAGQSAARKMVYDDVLGTCHDEHSRPFSYRTNSQNNLKHSKATTDDMYFLSKEPRNENITATIVVTKNYKQLQQELKKTLKRQLKYTKNENYTNVTTVNRISYKRLYNSNDRDPPKNFVADKCLTPIPQQRLMPQPDKVNLSHSLSNTPDITCLRNVELKQPNGTYADYTDAYFEEAISDEDEHKNYKAKDDVKTLCENIKFLENDTNLRKGFDFLNNW
ncbi:uncharacterized protein LOC129249832 isoform X4 [Anastrepha obliqua]|uniref:uncharacterized protein LOC129249832 isoform X4 n=1 Tax=Anastrepha obliqua TaxID=95512 RepID=UPI002409844A|nr:uncharacterized protein LOC129249832 isoform X4 [Anastrepha obliqua]